MSWSPPGAAHSLALWARTELTVHYHECDPSGIVFNANYPAYADIASRQSLESMVGPCTELAAYEVAA